MKSFFVQKDAIRPRDRGKGGDLVFARVLQLHCSLFPSALRLSLQNTGGRLTLAWMRRVELKGLMGNGRYSLQTMPAFVCRLDLPVDFKERGA